MQGAGEFGSGLDAQFTVVHLPFYRRRRLQGEQFFNGYVTFESSFNLTILAFHSAFNRALGANDHPSFGFHFSGKRTVNAYVAVAIDFSGEACSFYDTVDGVFEVRVGVSCHVSAFLQHFT
jgi:hypothetical protein